MLFGHREFVALIGSDEGHAMNMRESLKMELEGNELPLEGLSRRSCFRFRHWMESATAAAASFTRANALTSDGRRRLPTERAG